jgi:hypothetical protein
VGRWQMTLNMVCADELERREVYITKLKHDNYYWCFPIENQEYNIHDAIDFVHNKVRAAMMIMMMMMMVVMMMMMIHNSNQNLHSDHLYIQSLLVLLHREPRVQHSRRHRLRPQQGKGRHDDDGDGDDDDDDDDDSQQQSPSSF